jgi:hypothetical protein
MDDATSVALHASTCRPLSPGRRQLRPDAPAVAGSELVVPFSVPREELQEQLGERVDRLLLVLGVHRDELRRAQNQRGRTASARTATVGPLRRAAA